MTFHADLSVIKAARKGAFTLADNNRNFSRAIVTMHRPADKEAGLPATRKLDPTVQKAISHFSGCTHTPTLPSGLNKTDLELARRAVLTAFADSKFDPTTRIKLRLLTDEERRAGKASFRSVKTGKPRTFKFGSLAA